MLHIIVHVWLVHIPPTFFANGCGDSASRPVQPVVISTIHDPERRFIIHDCDDFDIVDHDSLKFPGLVC